MASKPEDEHAYILDSFEEFEALARRALHEGSSHTLLNELFNKYELFAWFPLRNGIIKVFHLDTDISNGEYIPQPNEVCSRLCNNQNKGDSYNSFTNGYGAYDGANAAYSSSSRIFSSPPG